MVYMAARPVLRPLPLGRRAPQRARDGPVGALTARNVPRMCPRCDAPGDERPGRLALRSLVRPAPFGRANAGGIRLGAKSAGPGSGLAPRATCRRIVHNRTDVLGTTAQVPVDNPPAAGGHPARERGRNPPERGRSAAPARSALPQDVVVRTTRTTPDVVVLGLTLPHQSRTVNRSPHRRTTLGPGRNAVEGPAQNTEI